MLRIGEKEVGAVRGVIRSGKPFRYLGGSQCGRFECRYAKFLDVKHVVQTSSGMDSLVAAMIGYNLGPGDEVLVPAHTFMASAVAVLAVGAIPVIVDIEEGLGIDPDAVADAAGPRTKAVMPVHMWGLPCRMDKLLRVARKRKLLVIEDAAQGIGGAFEGRMLGAIGNAGAFSFNYYKNMTCGEGGAVATNDDNANKRIRCAADCCRFYWTGRDTDFPGFVCKTSRASEFEGAMLNEQLTRLPAMIRAMRRQKKKIVKSTADVVRHAPYHSLDWECGQMVVLQLDSPDQADRFAELVNGTVLSKTGRHVYTQWDPILQHRGAPHPAMNPYNMPANRRCRRKYTLDMCRRSLDILDRSVGVGTHPDRTTKETDALIRRIRQSADTVHAMTHSSRGRR